MATNIQTTAVSALMGSHSDMARTLRVEGAQGRGAMVIGRIPGVRRDLAKRSRSRHAAVTGLAEAAASMQRWIWLVVSAVCMLACSRGAGEGAGAAGSGAAFA